MWGYKGSDAEHYSFSCTAVILTFLQYTISTNKAVTWTGYETNTENAKELNRTPLLDKIQDYRRNWKEHVNRMSPNRLPGVIKKQQIKRQKKPGETIEEASRHVKPEWVNK
jgi:hypothetical protein